MADLVTRLRDWEHVHPEDYNKDAGSLYDEAANRIEELEAQVKAYALQYLSDAGKMSEAIVDLTRRHEHALRKIDVLEDQLAEAIRALRVTDRWLRDLDMYANQDYHLAPSLQMVRDTLKKLEGI